MRHGLNYSAKMLTTLGELARGALHDPNLNIQQIHKRRRKWGIGGNVVEAVEVTYQQRGPTYRIVRQRVDREGNVETLAYQGVMSVDRMGDWKRKGGVEVTA